MKTGTTCDRLDRAAAALHAASSALRHGRLSSWSDKLHEALQLVTETLLNSEKLNELERFNLRAAYGTRLLGIYDCDSCWDAIRGCAIKLPAELEEPCPDCTDEPCIDHVRL